MSRSISEAQSSIIEFGNQILQLSNASNLEISYDIIILRALQKYGVEAHI